MIIVNGCILAKVMTGGELDADGFPTPTSVSWSEPFPCRVTTKRRNNLGEQNGNTFIESSYEVLVESWPFEVERVRLTQLGRELGEFSIIQTEILDSVNAIKIIV
jgi:hypothetical protein